MLAQNREQPALKILPFVPFVSTPGSTSDFPCFAGNFLSKIRELQSQSL